MKDASTAAAECSAMHSQLLHHQNLLGAAQETIAAHKNQARLICSAACPVCHALLLTFAAQMAEQQRVHEEEVSRYTARPPRCIFVTFCSGISR